MVCQTRLVTIWPRCTSFAEPSTVAFDASLPWQEMAFRHQPVVLLAEPLSRSSQWSASAVQAARSNLAADCREAVEAPPRPFALESLLSSDGIIPNHAYAPLIKQGAARDCAVHPRSSCCSCHVDSPAMAGMPLQFDDKTQAEHLSGYRDSVCKLRLHSCKPQHTQSDKATHASPLDLQCHMRFVAAPNWVSWTCCSAIAWQSVVASISSTQIHASWPPGCAGVALKRAGKALSASRS